jgi:proteasome assembly chaperone (PAC2) family protein
VWNSFIIDWTEPENQGPLMNDAIELRDPWLVAVWPGMGHVAMAAGYYLMSKLGMTALAELSARELFDVEHVEVKQGLIQAGKLPRNRLFVWQGTEQARDIVLFIGEAQPPLGKYAFCHKLIDYVRKLGVRRVFTFAAMATQMHPEHESRVFAAATNDETLSTLKRLELTVLNDGKASLAVLRVFCAMARVEIDFSELEEQATAIEQQLGEILSHVEEQMGNPYASETEQFQPEATDESGLNDADLERIEDLFQQVADDRSKAYELKRELDRLSVFDRYEDRFLDLFRKAE